MERLDDLCWLAIWSVISIVPKRLVLLCLGLLLGALAIFNMEADTAAPIDGGDCEHTVCSGPVLLGRLAGKPLIGRVNEDPPDEMPEGTCQVFGDVVDELGRPVCGAAVWLLPSEVADRSPGPSEAFRGRGTTTDESGQFRITFPFRGKLRVHVEGAVGWSEADPLDAIVPSARPLRLMVDRTIAVSGTVVGFDGSELAGVQVIPCAAGICIAGSVRTDASGSFSIRLPPSITKCDLWFGENEVQADGRADTVHMGGYVEEVPRGTCDLRLVCTAAAYIDGRIEEPLGACPWVVTVRHGHDPRYRMTRTTTTTSGEFRMGPLRVGPWSLSARSECGEYMTEELVLTAPSSRVILRQRMR